MTTQDEIVCWVCSEPAEEKIWEVRDEDRKPSCYAHCGLSRDGKHLANPYSVALVDGATIYDDGNRLLFDICCRECGQSGSFFVDISPGMNEVDWG